MNRRILILLQWQQRVIHYIHLSRAKHAKVSGNQEQSLMKRIFLPNDGITSMRFQKQNHFLKSSLFSSLSMSRFSKCFCLRFHHTSRTHLLGIMSILSNQCRNSASASQLKLKERPVGRPGRTLNPTKLIHIRH